MDKELKDKIKKAENLRKSHGFLASIFSKPDYITSGDLFCEVARGCENIEEKRKYYKEAAETYLMKKEEYNIYKASEVYKALFTDLSSTNWNEAIDFYALHAECLMRIHKFMMAGDSFMKIAESLKQKHAGQAIEFFKKARECFKKETNCRYHFKKAVEEMLSLNLQTGNIQASIEDFEILGTKFNVKHAKLCKQILCFLDEKFDLDDALEQEESQLIMALSNKEGEERTLVLERFANDNYLTDDIEKVFKLAIEKLKPEHDIC